MSLKVGADPYNLYRVQFGGKRWKIIKLEPIEYSSGGEKNNKKHTTSAKGGCITCHIDRLL